MSPGRTSAAIKHDLNCLTFGQPFAWERASGSGSILSGDSLRRPFMIAQNLKERQQDMKYTRNLLFLVPISFLFSHSSLASSMATCGSLFSDGNTYIGESVNLEKSSLQDIYQELNRVTSEKYPALAFLLDDPRAFLSQMQTRFEQQKSRGLDPHKFSYPEAGKPALDFATKALTEQISENEIETSNLRSQIKHASFHEFLQIYAAKTKIKEYTKAIVYARDLLGEIKNVEAANYPYLDVIELSYFATRLLGHFDFVKNSVFQKSTIWMDYAVSGYLQKSITKEYEYYKTRSSPVFQYPMIGQQFTPSARPFRRAFENKEKLSFVVIPTSIELANDIFQRLMPIQTHLFGMSKTPILADGFNRPSGLFWMHDVRHEATKYFKKFLYSRKHKLNEEQMHQIDQASERWFVELEQAQRSVKDPQLTAAIRLYAFNYHHDQGNPFIPSEFLKRRGLFVINSLFLQEVWSGQEVGFSNIRLLSAAEKWLEAFWQTKIEEEQLMLTQLGPRS